MTCYNDEEGLGRYVRKGIKCEACFNLNAQKVFLRGPLPDSRNGIGVHSGNTIEEFSAESKEDAIGKISKRGWTTE